MPLAGWRSFLWAAHCWTAHAAYPEVERDEQPLLPYLALLRVGFALPAKLLPPRCALTAPFHPYPDFHPGGIFSVALSVAPFPGPPAVSRHAALWRPDFPLPLPEATTRPAARIQYPTTLPECAAKHQVPEPPPVNHWRRGSNRGILIISVFLRPIGGSRCRLPVCRRKGSIRSWYSR